MKYFPIILIFLLLSSCGSSLKLKQQLNDRTAELAEARRQLVDLGSRPENMIIHTVYFKLQPDLSPQALQSFMGEIEKLKQIKQVKGLIYGPFTDLGDARAMKEYQLVMQMGFNSRKDYESYQANAIHLALKEAAKGYLAGPPVTHDFTTKELD